MQNRPMNHRDPGPRNTYTADLRSSHMSATQKPAREKARGVHKIFGDLTPAWPINLTCKPCKEAGVPGNSGGREERRSHLLPHTLQLCAVALSTCTLQPLQGQTGTPESHNTNRHTQCRQASPHAPPVLLARWVAALPGDLHVSAPTNFPLCHYAAPLAGHTTRSHIAWGTLCWVACLWALPHVYAHHSPFLPPAGLKMGGHVPEKFPHGHSDNV